MVDLFVIRKMSPYEMFDCTVTVAQFQCMYVLTCHIFPTGFFCLLAVCWISVDWLFHDGNV